MSDAPIIVASQVSLSRKVKCKALRGDGTPCRGYAVKDSDFCYYHTPGHGLSIFKRTHDPLDPRYAKYVPHSLRHLYDEAMSDTDLLSLEAEIRLLDARTDEILSGMDALPPPETWQRIVNLIGALRVALGGIEKIPLSVSKIVDEMDKLSQSLIDREKGWGHVLTSIEERRKLSESEIKRLATLKQFIPLEKAVLMIGALGASVKKHVDDPDTREKIARDLGRIAQGHVDIVSERAVPRG